MKLNIQPQCDNAPKKALIKQLTIYFASYDIEKAIQYLEDNVVWTLVGDKPIHGKQNFAAALKEMSHNKALELTIHSIITHGKEAAVNGEMLLENGQTFGFSDFYQFSSAKGQKIRSILSYVVELNRNTIH
ncbi:MAG: nuclear transport factor 2 family protein [Chitinophagales bacterium]